MSETKLHSGHDFENSSQPTIRINDIANIENIENIHTFDAAIRLDKHANSSVSSTNSTKEINNHESENEHRKRGPSTPLTPSIREHTIVRRKLEQPPRRHQYLQFATLEILEANYQNWLLKAQLKENEETIKFLELESKFSLEEVANP
ncbi:uncharacterized protein RJT20DRAFT_4719 [Scheffersomyces xylosifermentans]|uniref:uncharacterized protein n=1 Tax=Scheffersomyces xylosifermentans TaxID=1304137 RepID=UPI00315CD2DA